MSASDVTTAVYNRLTGIEVLTGAALAAQVALAALLSTDADTGKPGVYFFNMDDSPVAYPRITFRPNTGRVDPRFSLGVHGEDGVWDMEIWDISRLAKKITDIYAQVENLLELDLQVAPQLPSVSGEHIYNHGAFVPLTLLYDQNLNAWFGLCRWKIFEVRGSVAGLI